MKKRAMAALKIEPLVATDALKGRFMKSTLSGPKRQRGAASTWVFAGFVLVGLFFLLTEHRAHLYGWLPYLFLAACPLMHLFHGHGGHHSHGGDSPRRDDEVPPSKDISGGNAPPAQVAHHHH
jgi:hypothetical protein